MITRRRQAVRLSGQQQERGGQSGIFNSEAETHEDAVRIATKTVYTELQATNPGWVFRHRTSVPKREIHERLVAIGSQFGQVLHVKEASIRPDGGLIEVRDKQEQWRVVLVSEAKHQGNDHENLKRGVRVGKNKDQDLMSAGNAIERMHKNVNEVRNFMLAESHFPYVVFLQGSNFATEATSFLTPDGRTVEIRHNAGSMNRIDRVTAANLGMKLNTPCCRNTVVRIKDRELMLQTASIYARLSHWSQQEMHQIMLEIAHVSLDVLRDDLL